MTTSSSNFLIWIVAVLLVAVLLWAMGMISVWSRWRSGRARTLWGVGLGVAALALSQILWLAGNWVFSANEP